VFSQPAGPIKCAGAPQKIAYLAADYWRRQGLLERIRMILVLPDPAMFKVPVWAEVLEQVAARYGIEVRKSSEVVYVDGTARELAIADNTSGEKETVNFDFFHATPPQAAPAFIADSPLADPANPFGYVDVDQYSLAHKRYDGIFALGDVANLPTSKTGAAIRKQAPVAVANLLASQRGDAPSARYNGYTSCPVVTARHKMLLAEFDYDLKPTPSIPLVDTTKELTSMWLLKRYGLPALYWRGMLSGRI
jgi:sulfide:quinone oxidoreductase